MSITYLHHPITDHDLLRFARAAGASAQGEELTPQLREFAHMVMEKCARIADPFVDDGFDMPAGDTIRERFQGHWA